MGIEINNYIPSAFLPYSFQILTHAITPISYSKLIEINYIRRTKSTLSEGGEIEIISRSALDRSTKIGIIEQLINFGYLDRLGNGQVKTTDQGIIITAENTRGESTYIPVHQYESKCVTIQNPKLTLEEKVEAIEVAV